MASSNQFFLLKAEPLSHVVKGLEVGLFPYARFALQPHGEGVYTGVRNYAARNNMLKMALGGKAFYYHASCPEPGIAGIVTIANRMPDDDALDSGHPFYDPKHTREAPRWHSLTLRQDRPMKRFISLTELKSHGDGGLKDMVLLRNSRLSVQPVTKAEWDFVLELENRPAPAAAAKSMKRSREDGLSTSSSSSSVPASEGTQKRKKSDQPLKSKTKK